MNRLNRLVAIAVVLAGCTAAVSSSGSSSPAGTTPAPSPRPTSTPWLTDARQAIQDEAVAHHDDYCGRYLNNGFRDDLPAGAFVSMWRANLGAHEAAIRARTDGTEPLAFVGCTYSYEELRFLTDKQFTEDALKWLGTIPAAPWSLGPDEVANRVELDISSAVPDAADRALAHYIAEFQLPAGILHVWSDGNGAALRPWGTVRIHVLGPDGHPVRTRNGLGLEWVGDLPNLYCGVGDVGYGISADGTPTELPCQAGTWKISVTAGPDNHVVGSSTVTVTGGQTVDLKITVGVIPTPAP